MSRNTISKDLLDFHKEIPNTITSFNVTLGNMVLIRHSFCVIK